MYLQDWWQAETMSVDWWLSDCGRVATTVNRSNEYYHYDLGAFELKCWTRASRVWQKTSELLRAVSTESNRMDFEFFRIKFFLNQYYYYYCYLHVWVVSTQSRMSLCFYFDYLYYYYYYYYCYYYYGNYIYTHLIYIDYKLLNFFLKIPHS